jgi:isoleucyl-tRNA synthetase
LDLGGESVQLEPEDVARQLQAQEGYVAEAQDNVVVVLSTEITAELLREGLSRDVVRLVQEQRKQINCNYTDRIQVGIVTDSEQLRLAIQENAEFIKSETLTTQFAFEPLPGIIPDEHQVADATIQLFVAVV